MVSVAQQEKILIFFAFLIFLFLDTFTLQAQSLNQDTLERTSIELGYGRYNISDPRYKDVYEEGREIYTLEILQLLRTQNHHHLGLATGVKHFTKKGKSTITQEGTQLTLIPISLSGRYLLKIKSFIPWVEMGMDYYHYKESATIKITEGWAWGYHIAGGCYFEIPKVKFIKLKIYLRHT
ncbi:MAG: hypothetical protein OEW23_15400, partial [Candidatus Aminicenantes bacterium]|nr:hypothetical protein [Candidatus Aminicenantes bacterium]